MKEASGEYITLLSDDIWDPTYLEEQQKLLEKTGDDVALVYSDVKVIDDTRKLLHPSFLKWKNVSKRPEGFAFKENLMVNFIPAMSVVVKRKVFDKVGSYDESLAAEDVECGSGS